MIFTKNGITYRVGNGWLYRQAGLAEFPGQTYGRLWIPIAVLGPWTFGDLERA